jgi:hypothetical protein
MQIAKWKLSEEVVNVLPLRPGAGGPRRDAAAGHVAAAQIGCIDPQVQVELAVTMVTMKNRLYYLVRKQAICGGQSDRLQWQDGWEPGQVTRRFW